MSAKKKAQVWLHMTDTHDGSKTGLTHKPKNPVQKMLFLRWKEALDWFGEEPDVVHDNGDGWDGKDEKGKDIDEECMIKQAHSHAEIICMARPKSEVILTTGTRYHDSHKGQNFIESCKKAIEYRMLKDHNREIKVSIRRKLKTTINGWFRLEARHFIGGSSIPHGRATAPLRSQMWNVLNAALASKVKGKPVAWPNLLMFGHRHYYMAAENAWGDVVVLPSWQALGGIYGDEMMDGHVDLGLMKTTIQPTGGEGWERKKILFQAGVVERTEHR